MSDDLAAWLRSQVDDDETLVESDYDIMISARKVRDASAEIARLREERDKVMGYLSRLLKALYPTVDLLPDLLGVCTQIDHVLAGQREEITRLRAALATARREGMEEAAQMMIDLRQEPIWEENPKYGQYIVIRNRTPEEIAAAIRAAAKEVK